jgi:hypothetical protein
MANIKVNISLSLNVGLTPTVRFNKGFASRGKKDKVGHQNQSKQVTKPKMLEFDSLVNQFHKQIEQLPDERSGKNIRYENKDAGLAAFWVFFIQSPSFLAHQRAMETSKGQSNGGSLFHSNRKDTK